jgi:hypothetical protein
VYHVFVGVASRTETPTIATVEIEVFCALRAIIRSFPLAHQAFWCTIETLPVHFVSPGRAYHETFSDVLNVEHGGSRTLVGAMPCVFDEQRAFWTFIDAAPVHTIRER